MADPSSTDSSRPLSEGALRDARAAERLFERVYGELRRIAADVMRGERHDHTLQPTALVHEAWVRLSEVADAAWKDQDHFLAAAAGAMRRVLVDHARRRATGKRGGAARRVLLDDALAQFQRGAVDVLVLDEALTELGARDAELARVVELRFFGGLTSAQAGAVLGLTLRQVEGAWVTARGWLRRRLADPGPA